MTCNLLLSANARIHSQVNTRVGPAGSVWPSVQIHWHFRASDWACRLMPVPNVLSLYSRASYLTYSWYWRIDERAVSFFCLTVAFLFFCLLQVFGSFSQTQVRPWWAPCGAGADTRPDSSRWHHYQPQYLDATVLLGPVGLGTTAAF